MKAKLINTGEVVEVHKTTTGWASDNLNTTRFYNESELDFDYREWEIFRREAAKDIVCALLQDNRTSYSQPYEWFCKQAIELTDELIKQLREEKK